MSDQPEQFPKMTSSQVEHVMDLMLEMNVSDLSQLAANACVMIEQRRGVQAVTLLTPSGEGRMHLVFHVERATQVACLESLRRIAAASSAEDVNTMNFGDSIRIKTDAKELTNDQIVSICNSFDHLENGDLIALADAALSRVIGRTTKVSFGIGFIGDGTTRSTFMLHVCGKLNREELIAAANAEVALIISKFLPEQPKGG